MQKPCEKFFRTGFSKQRRSRNVVLFPSLRFFRLRGTNFLLPVSYEYIGFSLCRRDNRCPCGLFLQLQIYSAMTKEELRGHAALLGTNLIFGLNAPVAKSVLTGGVLTPYSLIFFRVAGAAALFWLASALFVREKIGRKDVIMLIFAALLGIVFNQGVFIIGLARTSPIDALILETLVPIMTMAIAAVYLKEPVTWKKAIGVFIGASGAVVLILSGSRNGTGGGTVAGNLIILISAAAYALYFTIFRNLISRYSPVTLMKWMFLFSAVVCLPFCYGDVGRVRFSAFTPDTWFRLTFIVGLATFLAYLMLPIGQKRLRPTVVSMYIYSQPVVATIAAVAMGLDTFGITKAVATALVFAGVWFVTQSKSREQLMRERTGASFGEKGERKFRR